MRRKASGKPVRDAEPTVRPLPTLLVGAFGGLLVGITSVGSGSVIMVVLLVLYPALAGVRLVGTDLVQAVPLVMAAALSHVIVTGIDWSVLIPLVVGGTPGTFLGRPAGQPRLAVDRPPRHRAGAVPDRSEHAEGAAAGAWRRPPFWASWGRRWCGRMLRANLDRGRSEQPKLRSDGDTGA